MLLVLIVSTYGKNGTGGVSAFVLFHELAGVILVDGNVVADHSTDVVCIHGFDSAHAVIGLSLNSVSVSECDVAMTTLTGCAAATGGVSVAFGNASVGVEVNTVSDFEVVDVASCLGCKSITAGSDAMYCAASICCDTVGRMGLGITVGRVPVSTAEYHTGLHETNVFHSGGRVSYDLSVAVAVTDFMSAGVSGRNSCADSSGEHCGCITRDECCSLDLDKSMSAVSIADVLCPSLEPKMCTVCASGQAAPPGWGPPDRHDRRDYLN